LFTRRETKRKKEKWKETFTSKSSGQDVWLEIPLSDDMQTLTRLLCICAASIVKVGTTDGFGAK